MLASTICHALSGVLVSSVWLCAGCGATGLAWVGEAHVDSAQQQTVNAAHSSTDRGPKSASIPATAEQRSSESRPRLQHTVTLGEIDVAVRADVAPRTEAFPSLSIYNYNYNQVNVAVPTFGYGTFRYSRSLPDFSPGRVTPPSPSGPQPGQDWPAVADHGPRFPYGSLPASPWTRTR